MSQNLSCRQLTQWLSISCRCQVENAGTFPGENAGAPNVGLMGYYPGNSSTESKEHRSQAWCPSFKKKITVLRS